MAFIEGWPHLRGGLYEGFHCSLTLSLPLSLSRRGPIGGEHSKTVQNGARETRPNGEALDTEICQIDHHRVCTLQYYILSHNNI